MRISIIKFTPAHGAHQTMADLWMPLGYLSKGRWSTQSKTAEMGRVPYMFSPLVMELRVMTTATLMATRTASTALQLEQLIGKDCIHIILKVALRIWSSHTVVEAAMLSYV